MNDDELDLYRESGLTATWARNQRMIETAEDILAEAVVQIAESGKELVAIVVLYSGGNDSTVLSHLFRETATHFGHCNTGIGIEETREFVRATVAGWSKPLIEVHPPAGSTYRELVLEGGFPGPAMHFKMYQRLKERGLREIRNQLVEDGRKQRVIFLSGRRRSESARRSQKTNGQYNLQPITREGSIVWVQPLIDWTSADLAQYRKDNPDVPRNEVSDNLHMSGECLCGAFARKDELAEIGFFYPGIAAEIRALEAEVAAAGNCPPERCAWGWGADKETPSKTGPLCADCVMRLPGMENAA